MSIILRIVGLEDLRWGKRAEVEVARKLRKEYRYVIHIDGPHPFDILAIDDKEIVFVEVKTGRAKQTEPERLFETFVQSANLRPVYRIVRCLGLKDRLPALFR